MTFNVACTPGRDAAVGYMRLTAELPALVLYLDPVNVSIQLPPFPGGGAVLAKFCRELAREAAKLAAAVDPNEGPASSEGGPRHLLTGDDDEPGGGS